MSVITAGQLSLVNCFTQAWTIENFTSYCEKTDSVVKIVSPSFFLNNDLSMFLAMTINNDDYDENGKGYVSVYLHLIKYVEDVKAEFEFCLLSAENKKVYTQDSPLIYTFSKKNENGFGRILHNKKTIIDPKSKLLLHDKLTIWCRLTIRDKKIDQPSLLFKNFSRLETLYNNENFTDTVLVVDDQELKVHKAVLALKSPVFYAMFCHNTKEANENLVKIDDVSFDVMKSIIEFIYTGRIENFKDYAKDLLPAADKYCIEELKVLCCHHIQDNLTIENAIEYLLLIDKCDVGYFLHFIKNFITGNIVRVMKTKGFQEAKKFQPDLLLDLTCKVIENKLN